ncbi:MAG: acetyl-CoA carboxylase carboxyl transferase subunit alpha, partial [Lachnospiraceae bacterium]
MLIDFIKKNAGRQESSSPVWKCTKCGAAVESREIRRTYYACPECGAYVRIHAYRRIKLLADEGSFE